MESQEQDESSNAPTSGGAGAAMDPPVAVLTTQDHSQYYGEAAEPGNRLLLWL